MSFPDQDNHIQRLGALQFAPAVYISLRSDSPVDLKVTVKLGNSVVCLGMDNEHK